MSKMSSKGAYLKHLLQNRTIFRLELAPREIQTIFAGQMAEDGLNFLCSRDGCQAKRSKKRQSQSNSNSKIRERSQDYSVSGSHFILARSVHTISSYEKAAQEAIEKQTQHEAWNDSKHEDTRERVH
jgi:hypothetical protein